MNPTPQAIRTGGTRRPRTTALALAAAVTVAVVAAAAPELVVTITEDSAQPAQPWGLFDAYPVEVFDFDGDGKKEVITHNDNRYVYVFRHDGVLLAELNTTFPPGWEARTINGVEAERVQPGGPPSLIVANSAAYLSRWDFVANMSNATHFEFTKVWEKRANAYTPNAGMDAKPTLHDVNSNGSFEIFVQVEEQGLYAYRQDGSVLWKKNASGGNAEPVLNDGDLDGHMEAYFFSDDGLVRVYDALTGAFEWSFDAKQHMAGPASITRGGTVAQVDGTGRKDVVFCARDGHDADNFTNNHMALFLIHNDDRDPWGNLKWKRQPDWANPLCYARPVVYDYNGNGAPEIYMVDWNTIGHNPGNWERTGPAHVFSYNKYGSLLWNTTLDAWWSNKDLGIADLDGDMDREVLVNGPSTDGARDGWWVLNVSTGAPESFLDVYPYKTTRGPRLADLDGDGKLDFVTTVEGHEGNTTLNEGAIQVWDFGTNPWRLAWSGAEDKYDRRAGFTAAFVPHADSNEWYVKVRIDSFHNVTQAWFNEDNGTWQALGRLGTGPDWTLWDAAENVPAGTVVQFKAKDDLGGVRVSAPFVWGPPDAIRPAPPETAAPTPPPGEPDSGLQVTVTLPPI